MLRFTTKGFNIFTQTQKKLPLLSQRLTTQLSTKYFASTSKFTSQFNDKLLSGKYYQVLGYPSGTNLEALTDTQVKRQYLAMVKKYHSDGVVDPVQKLENEEITKCIIQAFDKITQNRIRTQIEKGIYDKIYNDEDEIAMKIYGKKFNDIKYELFKEGNGAKRAEFMEELQKIRKDSKYYDQVKEKQAETSAKFAQQQAVRQTGNTDSIKSRDSGSGSLKFVIPGIGLLVIGLLVYQNQKQTEAASAKTARDKSKHTLGQDKIKQIEKRSTELHEKKLSDIIDSFVEEQPPCLKYPQNQDPDQINQLIEFTIGPDINLYEISSELLAKKQNLEQLKQIKSEEELKQKFGDKYNPFPLTRIKPNSQITLSLEAERCLQNIYIKVKDVADEIQEKGKYTPPKIFFRYFGYVMFDIRQKPLSLANYRDTEYISLFDLFFDYYSPIPVKRHEYNEYVVGLKDDEMKMFGQVHINNKRIPERYIGKDDKVVVMRDEVHQEEKKNVEIWDDFYRKYQKIWTRGTSERIRLY